MNLYPLCFVFSSYLSFSFFYPPNPFRVSCASYLSSFLSLLQFWSRHLLASHLLYALSFSPSFSFLIEPEHASSRVYRLNAKNTNYLQCHKNKLDYLHGRPKLFRQRSWMKTKSCHLQRAQGKKFFATYGRFFDKSSQTAVVFRAWCVLKLKDQESNHVNSILPGISIIPGNCGRNEDKESFNFLAAKIILQSNHF